MVTATLCWSDEVLTTSSRGAAQPAWDVAIHPAIIVFSKALFIMLGLLDALRQDSIMTEPDEKRFRALE
jgi:hypothetical protein